jgi:hypothetical protein
VDKGFGICLSSWLDWINTTEHHGRSVRTFHFQPAKRFSRSLFTQLASVSSLHTLTYSQARFLLQLQLGSGLF